VATSADAIPWRRLLAWRAVAGRSVVAFLSHSPHHAISPRLVLPLEPPPYAGMSITTACCSGWTVRSVTWCSLPPMKDGVALRTLPHLIISCRVAYAVHRTRTLFTCVGRPGVSCAAARALPLTTTTAGIRVAASRLDIPVAGSTSACLTCRSTARTGGGRGMNADLPGFVGRDGAELVTRLRMCGAYAAPLMRGALPVLIAAIPGGAVPASHTTFLLRLPFYHKIPLHTDILDLR